jgi:ribosomal-protein-alanine N-acetyltransferase
VESERLTYRPVTAADLDAFHSLVEDAHIRRYMMDGNLFPPSWSAGHIRQSEELFRRLGVGLWLAYDTTSGELVGFCGFLILPEVLAEPELVYALPERFCGKGLATEMARASIAEARRLGALGEIVASADEVNRASVRVLEKLGFVNVGKRPGAFGDMLLLRLPPPRE